METAVLENPVIKDSEGDSLRDAALAVDRGEPTEVPSVTEAEPHVPATPEPVVTQPEDKGKPDNSEITLETKPEEKKERERDPETGKFIKKEGEADTQVEAKPEVKETTYERAKKEQDRRDRSWEALNKEKDEFRKQREEELTRINEERRQLQSSMQTRNGDKPSDGQYTAEDYEAAAREFDGTGDAQLAQQARDAAKAIRVVQQQTENQRQVQQFETEYAQAAQALIEKEPDAGKPDTPLFKEISATYEAAPILWKVPNGFGMALEYAKAKLDARLVSELKDKTKQLQTEVDRLNGLTQPAGSGPTTPSAAKKFEDMTLEQQEAHLRQASRRTDGT